jgi:hypothetical protein
MHHLLLTKLRLPLLPKQLLVELQLPKLLLRLLLMRLRSYQLR